MELTQEKRKKLDGIVQTMLKEGYDDKSIQNVVNDFKSRQAKPFDPVALYKQSIGQVSPSSVANELTSLQGKGKYVAARDTFKERDRKEKERTLDTGETFTALNDAARMIQDYATDNPVVSTLGAISKAAMPGFGQKGPIGQVAGAAGGLVAGPVDLAADVVRFVGTGEWQAAANILWKSGALIIPAGKAVKAVAGSKVGINAGKAFRALVDSGMAPAQAKKAVTHFQKELPKFDISPSKVESKAAGVQPGTQAVSEIGRSGQPISPDFGETNRTNTPPLTKADFEVSGPSDTHHNPFGDKVVSTSRSWFVKANDGNVAQIKQVGGGEYSGDVPTVPLSYKAKPVPLSYEVNISHTPEKLYGTTTWSTYRKKFDNLDDAIAHAKEKLPELTSKQSPLEASAKENSVDQIGGVTEKVTPPVTPDSSPVKEPLTTGRVKDTPQTNTQLANAIRELDPFDDTGYELLDAAHRRLKGSPLPKVNDPSEFARLRDSLADEIDSDSLNLEAQRMDVDARKQAGKEAAEYFKGEKWGTVKDAPDPFVTVRQNKSGAYVEGRAVPMVSLERFTGGGEHIAADIVSAFDTRGWGDDVAVLPRSVLKERQYGRGENRATGIRLSEMGTRYTPDQIRNGEAKLEEVYIPQGWMKEYVRNARFRANELEYPRETLIYDDPGVISAARKDVAEVREILGIDPYQKTAVSDKELMAAAKEHNAYEVMADVNAGKTASASQQQSMAVEFQRLRNEMRAAKDADEIDKYRDLWEKAGNLADALDKVGSEAGRTMRARRLIVDDAFDTFGLTRAIESAQDGKPLTAKQQVNVENLVNDTARIRKELAKTQKELDDIRAGGEIQARAKRAPRFSRQELDDELESLLTQFKAGVSKASSGIDPELIPIVGKIALNYAKRGINTIDEIVEAIQGHIPNISRQEVIDAIAMPGEPRTKSELAKSLSELRTEAKRLSTPTQAKKATAAENMAAKKAETQRLAGIKRDRIEAERLEKAGRRAEAKALRDDIASRAKGEKKAQDAQEALERGNAADLKRKADRVRDVQKKIAEYERRIREGDFVTPTKDEMVKTNQLRQLEGEMDYRRKQFESMRKMAASDTSKSMTVAKELSGIVRYSTLSADLGQLLRQGRYAIVHGKSYAKGLTAAVQSIGNEKNFRAIMHELDNKRIGGQFMPSVRKKAGLSLTDSVNDFEEGFVSKIMQKVPIIGKPLERFQSAFMNTVRADMFDTFATRFDDLSEAELKARAQLINSLTGRSNLKSVPDALGVIMTSPRWTASRYELLFRPVKDVKLALQGNRGAKENLKTWAAGAATYIAPLIIADRVLKAQNPDWGVQWNDESGDAWKVRVGDHVYDIGGSVSIPLRTVSRMVKGIYERDPGFTSREALKTAMNTINPGVRTPIEMYAGTDLMGFPDDEKDVGWLKLAPLIAQSVYKNVRDNQGPAFTAADTLAEFIGLGANTNVKSKNPVQPIPRGTLTKDGKPKKTKVFGY